MTEVEKKVLELGYVSTGDAYQQAYVKEGMRLLIYEVGAQIEAELMCQASHITLTTGRIEFPTKDFAILEAQLRAAAMGARVYIEVGKQRKAV